MTTTASEGHAVMEPWEVSARLGVADLLGRYQRLADAGRLDEVVALFTDDAIFETNTGRHVGHEQIRDFCMATGRAFVDSGLLVARHHLSSIVIQPKPDGTASTYACFLWVGTAGPDHWGSYRDQVRHVDGQWRFAHRRAIIDGHVATSPVAALLGLPSD